MNCNDKYTQALIFEWVKDGNKQFLKECFSLFNQEQLTYLFGIRDQQKRTILHWAAYLGQVFLLDWWLTEYSDIIKIDLEDDQHYSPLELGLIRGFNCQYDQELQFRTAQILIIHGAQLNRKQKKIATPLHWAFYYGNLDLIIFIMDKCWQIVFSQDEHGYYPIDYLLLEKKEEILKQNNENIFKTVVQKYIDTNQFVKRRLEFAVQKRTLKCSPEIFSDKCQKISKNNFDDEALFNIEPDPINSYNPNQYNLQTIRPDLFPLKIHRRAISKQLNNILAVNSECNSARSDSQKSEPEEEKLPPIIMMKMTQKTSPNRVDLNQKNISLFSMESIASRKIISPSYSIYHHKKSMTKTNLYETRLLFWSSSLGMTKFVNYFLYRKCKSNTIFIKLGSPFMISFDGFNSFHVAAQKGQFEILKIFLEGEYIYQEYQEMIQTNKFKKTNLRYHTFNRKHCLNMLTHQLPSNALHLAIESENYQCMRLLYENKVSTKKFNYRTLRPFELTFNEKIVDFYSTNIKLVDPTNFQQQGYYYVLQTPAKQSYLQDIVYLQLMNINETFHKYGWKLEFLILKSPNYLKLKQISKDNIRITPKYFFYILKLSPNIVYQLADKYKLLCYHLKKKYICQFSYSERMSFEFPKDIQIQTMIINTLNEEFDVDKFVLEGLIISHFPLRDPQKCEDINRCWQKRQTKCIRNTIKLNTNQRSLLPLHYISNYYGPVIGWYFAFMIQLVGWLTFPSIFGVALAIYILITQSYFSKIIPLYALFMAIWSTLFIEKWKNRTWELKFSWDMHDYKKNEPQRVMYTGQFTFDQLTKKICIKDYFTTFQRRLFSDIPIIFLGLCFITITFYSFYQWNQVNQGNLFMIVFINSLNGTCITLISSLYKLICGKLIQWENHKYESEQQFSYILKVYLFEFLNSYITVFYYAVFEEDALRLGLTVGSIVITRGVIQNVTSNIIPYIKQKIKLKIFRENFNLFQKIYLNMLVDENSFQIDIQDHIQEKISPKLILEFLQQIEECVLQEPQKLLFDEYTSLAIQFGYITMFSPSFPGAPIFFMVNTYLNLKLSLYCYKSVMKRQTSLPAESLGIWENIFAIMNYAATFMNCIVIGRANKSQLANLIGHGSFLRDVIILVSVEHIILFIKFILETIVPDIPYWVKNELKRYKFYKKRYHK